MKRLIEEYRQALEQRHDWHLELECPSCRRIGLPQRDGWSETLAVNWGDNPTIFMKLTCTACGRDLRETAGQRLREEFGGIQITKRNRLMIRLFLLFILGVPILAAAVMGAGVALELWGADVFLYLVVFAFLSAPGIMMFNYQIASLRRQCACGTPDYRFLGMLGRSYCYACATCGRLLRIRD